MKGDLLRLKNGFRKRREYMLEQNSLFPSDYHEELAISLGLLLRLASGVDVVTHIIFSTS